MGRMMVGRRKGAPSVVIAIAPKGGNAGDDTTDDMANDPNDSGDDGSGDGTDANGDVTCPKCGCVFDPATGEPDYGDDSGAQMVAPSVPSHRPAGANP